jgi:hypothetical protein
LQDRFIPFNASREFPKSVAFCTGYHVPALNKNTSLEQRQSDFNHWFQCFKTSVDNTASERNDTATIILGWTGFADDGRGVFLDEVLDWLLDQDYIGDGFVKVYVTPQPQRFVRSAAFMNSTLRAGTGHGADLGIAWAATDVLMQDAGKKLIEYVQRAMKHYNTQYIVIVFQSGLSVGTWSWVLEMAGYFEEMLQSPTHPSFLAQLLAEDWGMVTVRMDSSDIMGSSVERSDTQGVGDDALSYELSYHDAEIRKKTARNNWTLTTYGVPMCRIMSKVTEHALRTSYKPVSLAVIAPNDVGLQSVASCARRGDTYQPMRECMNRDCLLLTGALDLARKDRARRQGGSASGASSSDARILRPRLHNPPRSIDRSSEVASDAGSSAVGGTEARGRGGKNKGKGRFFWNNYWARGKGSGGGGSASSRQSSATSRASNSGVSSTSTTGLARSDRRKARAAMYDRIREQDKSMTVDQPQWTQVPMWQRDNDDDGIP